MRYFLISFITIVNCLFANEYDIRLAHQMPKNKTLILAIQQQLSTKMLSRVNGQVVQTLDNEVLSTLQTQATITKTDELGQWTEIIIKPYSLSYVVNKVKKDFANLNELIKINRDRKKLDFTFAKKPIHDIAILKTFFKPLPMKPVSVFDSSEKVKKGAYWFPEKTLLKTFFNKKQKTMKLTDKSTVKMNFKLKDVTDKHLIVDGNCLYKGIVPADQRLHTLKENAAFSTVKINAQIPLPGSKAPFSASTLCSGAYTGELDDKNGKVDFTMTHQEKQTKLVKEIE